VKAFVVVNTKNEDYLTNPESKRPVFCKHSRQIITDGIPMLQKYLDPTLKKSYLCRQNLQNFLQRSNIGRLNQTELNGVKQFVHFCGTNIGAQSYSSLYSGKISELRRAMDYALHVRSHSITYVSYVGIVEKAILHDFIFCKVEPT